MKIISFNVNGIRAIMQKSFVEDMKKVDADIICLQETKATVEQVKEAEKLVAKTVLILSGFCSKSLSSLPSKFVIGCRLPPFSM